MFNQVTRPLSYFLLTLCVLSCLSNEVKVKFNIKVKNSQGSPVESAAIEINGKEIGKTNAEGVFESELSLPGSTKANIEITKSSDNFYFAPFYESVVLTSAEVQNFPIEATLYFVPKPTADDVARLEQEDPPESKPSADSPEVNSKLTEAASEKLEKKTVAEEKVKKDQPKEETPVIDVATKKEIAAKDSKAVIKTDKYPAKKLKNKGSYVYTVHAYSAKKPVAGASVYLGKKSSGNLRLGCKTNSRGRCVVRFKTLPKSKMTFVVKKPTFQTQTKTVAVKHRGRTRFNLKRGDSIDIFALTKKYNFTRGVVGLEVFVQGEKVGVTDSFGHLTYVYTGKKSDLVEVRIVSKTFLPEEYVTDFVVAGPMSLVRYFSPQTPPPVTMAVLNIRPAGRSEDLLKAKAFNKRFNRTLKSAARSSIFQMGSFSEFPIGSFKSELISADRSLDSIINKGWAKTDLKADVDAVLLPTLIVGKTNVLELSVIDSRGKTLVAAKEALDSLEDMSTVKAAVRKIATRIKRRFPFEGSVLGKDGKFVTINLGYNSGRAVKVGDKLEVFGIQTDKFGLKQLHKKIGALRVKEVWDSLARTTVESKVPRSAIHRGDLVVLHAKTQRRSPANMVQIRVNGSRIAGQSEPVAQANIYFNDRWIGASDQLGKLNLPAGSLKGSVVLKVIKHGYRDFAKEVKITNKMRKIDVSIEREVAFLQLESEPPAAEVKIDGKVVGVTPISKPIPIPSGFVSIEIDGPDGYKTYKSVLDLTEGILDLSGSNMIVLEKDYRLFAKSLLEKGKVKQALAKLREIPKDHSDYLVGAHERGVIYLTKLDRPALAAKAFGKVTSNRNVAKFIDKRFVGSHINEAIAIFKTAEKIKSQEPKAAEAHYLKSLSIFDRVASQLRFVPKAQYDQAVHNVSYHTALAKHRVWTSSKNITYLNDALKSWQSYLDTYGSSDKSKGKFFRENARIYFKQAQSSVSAKNDRKL